MAGFWEFRFDELAQYNADTSRGLLLSEEKRDRMAKLQKDYDAKLLAHCQQCNVKAIPLLKAGYTTETPV